MSDPDEIDALAAEYALGTLERAERERLDVRRKIDPVLDEAILSWEARLAPLAESIPELAPPPGLFAQIEQRIESAAAPRQTDTVDLDARRRLKWWRGGALAASALAACLALALGLREQTRPPARTFVAVLQKNAASPGFLLSLDPASRTLAIRPLAASIEQGKSYELWLVAKAAAPLSLGVIDPKTKSVKKIAADLQTAENATWAVSLEPAGGSPTGAPTGPIVFSGKFTPAGS